ncbi:MAG: porin [Elusimicrobiota bacterium]
MKKIFWITVFIGWFSRLVFCMETDTNAVEDSPKIKPTGFASVRFTVDTTAGNKDGFTIAQARFGAKGDITKDVAFSFSLEGTNTDTNNNKTLYDIYLDVKSVPYFTLRLGQFKYKFSLENVISDADLELINKSDVISNLVSPTRDIGIELSREFSFSSVKGNIFAGIMNGSGSNQSDENDNKMAVARLVFSPVKGLNLGSSYYDSAISTNTFNKDRIGLEMKYEVETLLCKAEYILGQDDSISEGKKTTTKKEGYYITIGYTMFSSCVLLARYDVWDSSLKTIGKKNSRWTFGINYFLDKNVLLRNNYEQKTESPSVKNDLIMTQLQVKF